MLGGAAWAVRGAGRLQAVADNLVVQMRSVKAHKFGLNSGIVLHVVARLKNPSVGRLRFTQPYITLFLNGSELGDSQVTPRAWELGGMQEIDVPFVVTISPLQAVLVGLPVLAQWVMNWTARRPVVLTLRTKTRINDTFPVVSDTTIPVNV